MTIFRPFQCIRPRADQASTVAALPYDVYTSEEARTIVKQNPASFLAVDRGETLLPEGTDPYSAKVYEKAAEKLQEMIQEKIFIKDGSPGYYLYELTMDVRSQTGFVGLCSVDDYENNTILRHENTRAQKEEDRIRHISTLKAQTGPIFLAFRSEEKFLNLMEAIKNGAPLYDFFSEDKVRHRVWKVCDDTLMNRIQDAFSSVPHLYIADGHHRAASAVRVAQNERRQHPDYTGNEEYNYFLSVAFPDDQLKILDYNRVIADLNGYTPDSFLKEIRMRFHVENCGSDPVRPNHRQEFGLYVHGAWYRITPSPRICSDDPAGNLDVTVLQELILAPVLGIHDPKTDSRIRFIGGISGLLKLQELVDEQGDGAAFSMYPTSMQELFQVADAHMLMPPKSTWFEPKLRSGLFIHQI